MRPPMQNIHVELVTCSCIPKPSHILHNVLVVTVLIEELEERVLVLPWTLTGAASLWSLVIIPRPLQAEQIGIAFNLTVWVPLQIGQTTETSAISFGWLPAAALAWLPAITLT